MTVAVYPGSFDPITNGHLDIAARAAKLFEKLIIGVYDTPSKNLMFTTAERLEFVKQSIGHLPNVEAQPFTGLTVEFARSVGARGIVRGLRAMTDFENEFGMAMMNKKLSADCEVVCLMTNIKFQFLSASLLKEVARLGGNVEDLVPPAVYAGLKKRIAAR
jgi:pantetheine-phosphate adenylyltransferase